MHPRSTDCATWTPKKLVIHTVVSAKCYLDHGYTMCFGAASAKKRLDIAVRDFINLGKVPSPRYLANGPEISTTGGAIIPGITIFADGESEMRKVVRELIVLGVDNIKLSMTGTSQIALYKTGTDT